MDGEKGDMGQKGNKGSIGLTGIPGIEGPEGPKVCIYCNFKLHYIIKNKIYIIFLKKGLRRASRRNWSYRCSR